MNYAIFRSEPIMSTNDLAQIGSHNQREKKAYKFNLDIRIEDSYKNIHLSQLQDKYHERLINAGFDLERGIKGSSREHLKIKELKKTTQYYENKIQIINKNLDKAINDLNEKMKTTKNTIFDKEYVKVKRETFDSMNKVIKETKKVVEFQPKIEQLFNEVNNFTKSHQTLEKENSNLKQEVKSLITRNQNLIAFIIN